ncbi:hypothetical protein Pfo_011312 [Paulownia fortunei]|nr:hypothetical protein Pfo_011312 [Paulownia fortunei]
MKLVNDDSFKTSLGEDDVTLSTFRKRNKILILVFLILIISLTLILCALIIYLVHNNNIPQSNQPLVNPAVEASCNTPSCLKTFNPIISTKSVIDPNQILTLSLQTAAKELENIVSLILSTSGSVNKTVIAFKNCQRHFGDNAGEPICGDAE